MNGQTFGQALFLAIVIAVIGLIGNLMVAGEDSMVMKSYRDFTGQPDPIPAPIEVIVYPGEQPQPVAATAIPYITQQAAYPDIPPTIAPTSTPRARAEELAVNTWEGAQVDLSTFPPAAENQVYLIHGDVFTSNECYVLVAGPGQSPADLNPGRASWKIWRITGTPQQLEAEINRIQAGAAGHSITGICPRGN